MKLLLVLLVLCSCAPPIPIPGFDTTMSCEMESGCPAWDPELVSNELQRFQTEWSFFFQEEPFVPATITVTDDLGTKGDDIVLGEAMGEDVTVVGNNFNGERTDIPVEQTMLVHECIHVTLTNTGHQGNHHSGGAWTTEHERFVLLMVNSR